MLPNSCGKEEWRRLSQKVTDEGIARDSSFVRMTEVSDVEEGIMREGQRFFLRQNDSGWAVLSRVLKQK